MWSNRQMAKKKDSLIPVELSPDQSQALALLQSGENVFLSGGAGSGKSFVVREFRKGVNPKTFPLLASTGAAAVLLEGRTFHSFFGLGILEGGPTATFERLKDDPRLMNRLRSIEGFVIDEVSMIPSSALDVSEALLRLAKGSQQPWGGLRAIVVGDFAQLPPVARHGQRREWAFQSKTWERSGFIPYWLKQNHRVYDSEFLEILQEIRTGQISPRVKEFLQLRTRENDESDKGPRLFPRRDQVDRFNQMELAELPGEEKVFDSIYFGKDKAVETLTKSGPIPPKLVLKVGCRVLFVQNDPQKRWVNGTRGTVVEVTSEAITVEKENWRQVTVDRAQFSYMDGDGNVVASVINFPLVLGYATTIHKSQGATLEDLWVNLSHLWEPGQAYVALSRLRSGNGLKLLDWSPKSFLVDPQVINFYKTMAT